MDDEIWIGGENVPDFTTMLFLLFFFFFSLKQDLLYICIYEFKHVVGYIGTATVSVLTFSLSDNALIKSNIFGPNR